MSQTESELEKGIEIPPKWSLEEEVHQMEQTGEGKVRNKDRQGGFQVRVG